MPAVEQRWKGMSRRAFPKTRKAPKSRSLFFRERSSSSRTATTRRAALVTMFIQLVLIERFAAANQNSRIPINEFLRIEINQRCVLLRLLFLNHVLLTSAQSLQR